MLIPGSAPENPAPARSAAPPRNVPAAPQRMGSAARRIASISLGLNTRVIRFGLVGAVGVGVSTAVLWVSTRSLGLPTAWGGFVAAVVSTGTNFLMNDAFTWRDRRSPGLRAKAGRLVRYYSTTAAGNLVYLAVLAILVHQLGLYVLAANIVAIGVGGVFNYVFHNLWTWRGSGRR